jgi:hypothetical protein
MIIEHQITSVTDFIEKLGPLFTQYRKLWFRGHPDNINYRLAPSVYRPPFSPDRESILMDTFKSKAVPYLDHKPNSYWEWLFIMQHHALPTRLLDWSESPLIALAFAVQQRNEKNIGTGASVWLLNPVELNKKQRFIRNTDIIPNINEAETIQNMFKKNSNDEPEYPVAIIGPLNTQRIIAQKGVFTLFPIKGIDVMENLSSNEDFLIKFNIEESDIIDIATQLYKLGITENSLYPGLDSIAKEIREEMR